LFLLFFSLRRNFVDVWTDFAQLYRLHWKFRHYKDTHHPKPTIAQKKLLYQRCEDHDLFRLPPAWSRGENPNFGHIEGPMLVKVMGKKNFTVAKVVVSLHLNVQHCEMVPWESHHDDHGWPGESDVHGHPPNMEEQFTR